MQVDHPLQLHELNAADADMCSIYNRTFSEVWPDFAMSDAEFQHELVMSGPAQRWLVRAPDSGSPIGAVAVERPTWNEASAAPYVMALLPEQFQSMANYHALILPCASFARSLQSDALRILVWDYEDVMREYLSQLPNWEIVEREIDVGLDLTSPMVAAFVVPESPGLTIETVAEAPHRLPQIHALLTETVPTIPGADLHTVPAYDRWVSERQGPLIDDALAFIAIDTQTDSVVGFSELTRSQALEGVVWQGYTVVSLAARGRGIARLLKTHSAVVARALGCKQIRTENEERNAPIRHIDQTMGFAPIGTRLLYRGPCVAIGRCELGAVTDE